MSLGTLLTRVAHAIFDPSRSSRRTPPAAVGSPRNPAPPAAGAAPDQATGLVKLAQEVGVLPAAVIADIEKSPATPEQIMAATPLLRRYYTPKSMIN